MTDILFTANGASATVQVNGELTSGMVGVPVRFAFDSDWDGLNIVAVFDGGGHRISVPLLTDMEAVLPWEVIAKANTRLRIGAEGRKSDGSVVVPTVWANAGYIKEGAVATDEEGNPPTPGIYDQIMAAIKAGQLKGDPGKDGDDGISPAVSVTEIEGGHRVTITDAIGTKTFDVMNGKDGSGASVSIVDNLGSNDPNAALSARMGGVLKTKIEDDVSALNAQLQPQINQRVKTVNGVAPDENGNVTVEGGPVSSGVHIFRSDEEVDFTALVDACASGEPVYWYDVPSMVMYPAINCEPGYPRVVFGFVDHYNTLNLVVVEDGLGVEYRNVELVTEDKVTSAISQHNTDTGSHADIREQITRVEGAIPTDTYINTLIDAKLGVIENGTY